MEAILTLLKATEHFVIEAAPCVLTIHFVVRLVRHELTNRK